MESERHDSRLAASAGTDTFTYDPTGNMATRTVDGTTQTLTWDHSNRLAQVARGAQTSTYAYTAAGERIRRTDGTTTTITLAGIYEAKATGTGAVTVTKHYLFAGQRVAVRIGGSLYYTLGQVADAATGLVYYGARYYDPSLGRFTSADTVTPGTGSTALNRYAYANNNPANLVDPTGQSGCRIGGAPQPDGGCDLKQTPGYGDPAPPAPSIRVIPSPSGGSLNEPKGGLIDPEALAMVIGDPFAAGINFPSEYIPWINQYADSAGIDPALLVAIIQHEGFGVEGFSPWSKAFEGWAAEHPEYFGPGGASIGLGQMDLDTFVETALKHSDEIGISSESEAESLWADLASSPTLAIEATAFRLADIQREVAEEIQRENVLFGGPSTPLYNGEIVISMNDLTISRYNVSARNWRSVFATGHLYNPHVHLLNPSELPSRAGHAGGLMDLWRTVMSTSPRLLGVMCFVFLTACGGGLGERRVLDAEQDLLDSIDPRVEAELRKSSAAQGDPYNEYVLDAPASEQLAAEQTFDLPSGLASDSDSVGAIETGGWRVIAAFTRSFDHNPRGCRISITQLDPQQTNRPDLPESVVRGETVWVRVGVGCDDPSEQ